MTCGGCEAAVRKSLGKLEGVVADPTPDNFSAQPFCLLHPLYRNIRLPLPTTHRTQSLEPCSAGVQSVDVDLPTQKVLVKGNVTPEAVVQQVSKTGKPTELWK